MSNILDLKQKNLDGFKNIWEKLLVHKVEIIYDISIEKNINFFELLKDVLPEANDYKHLWQDKFIIKHTPKVVDHIHCSNPLELNNTKNKKIDSKCSTPLELSNTKIDSKCSITNLKTKKKKKFKIIKSL